MCSRNVHAVAQTVGQGTPGNLLSDAPAYQSAAEALEMWRFGKMGPGRLWALAGFRIRSRLFEGCRKLEVLTQWSSEAWRRHMTTS
jgi:hypothetical protein